MKAESSPERVSWGSITTEGRCYLNFSTLDRGTACVYGVAFFILYFLWKVLRVLCDFYLNTRVIRYRQTVRRHAVTEAGVWAQSRSSASFRHDCTAMQLTGVTLASAQRSAKTSASNNRKGVHSKIKLFVVARFMPTLEWWAPCYFLLSCTVGKALR